MQPIPEYELDDGWLLEVHPELLVINKPAGLSVLRDRSGQVDLWQRLTTQFGKLYQVHRIDKATSGLLLVARNQNLQSSLTRQFNQRNTTKTYLADVHGELALQGTGTIDLPLRKGRKSRYRVAAQRETILRTGDHWQVSASDSGVSAYTRLRHLDALPGRTRLVLQPRTGRTHQLRVHLAWIGHAIVGDPLYGSQPARDDAQYSPRMLLHAARLVIPGYGRWTAPVDSSWEP